MAEEEAKAEETVEDPTGHQQLLYQHQEGI